ncbi:hypothetical protein D1AOALGA4SA_3839 [Olavius algarvensis Delta 1 endosymbiont]|nr:hypothetical protein D1AOALGA4SA_3839 [Olavius algarvensis Delta 1 endosymbiont]
MSYNRFQVSGFGCQDSVLRFPDTSCETTFGMTNVECRMSNDGFASLCRFKIDRIHSFDLRYSLFDIRYSLFRSFLFDQIGCPLAGGRRSYETTEPAHKLKIDQNKLQNCRSNILNLVNVL